MIYLPIVCGAWHLVHGILSLPQAYTGTKPSSWSLPCVTHSMSFKAVNKIYSASPCTHATQSSIKQWHKNERGASLTTNIVTCAKYLTTRGSHTDFTEQTLWRGLSKVRTGEPTLTRIWKPDAPFVCINSMECFVGVWRVAYRYHIALRLDRKWKLKQP